MTFHLTKEDIAAAKRYGLRNALLYLICNRTGTLWRMTECGVGMETMPPYRTLRVCDEDATQWQFYQANGLLVPCRLRVEIYPYGARLKSTSLAPAQVAAQRVLAQTSPQITLFLLAP